MSSLLDDQTLQVIKAALKDVVDTFFKTPITINHRSALQDKYQEGLQITSTPHNFLALSNFSVGEDGRYKNVKQGAAGQELHDAWTLLVWKADVDNIPLVVDAEQDTVTISGREYHIRMFSSTIGFGALGDLFYHLEMHYDKGTFEPTIL